MNILKISALIFATLFAGGCASSGWKADSAPVPRTTPYDGNEQARTAFLDGFRDGYRFETSGGGTTTDTLSGPNPAARRQGYDAGVAAARAEKAPGK